MNIAVTTGDPAGIGPDIVLALAHHAFEGSITALADIELLEQRAAQLNLKVSLEQQAAGRQPSVSGDGRLNVHHIPVKSAVAAGVADVRNAPYVLRQIDTAVTGCLDGLFDAMVTGPVSKAVISQSGVHFPGHTEYLAHATNSIPVMMLTTQRGFRVALATTHIPLREVADAITSEKLEQTFRIISNDLDRFCSIAHPRIGVCGLNPHAGEQGQFGTEDAEIIQPAVEKARGQGLNITGPLPADTIFNTEQLQRFDVIVAMFHDQGLPVIKHADFGNAVNVTLGLPFLRTSVDHGTAFELAGSGKARADSIITAINWTVQATRCATS